MDCAQNFSSRWFHSLDNEKTVLMAGARQTQQSLLLLTALHSSQRAAKSLIFSIYRFPIFF